MSRRLCCYEQQQHSKLLTVFLFKMFVYRFNTWTMTRASLPDDRIRNALIHCQDMRTQSIDVFDPPFADLFLHY